MIQKLTENDIGRWVICKPDLENERGKIKAYNNKRRVAWVVYKANNNWDGDNWKDYTAAMTNYSDLFFSSRK